MNVLLLDVHSTAADSLPKLFAHHAPHWRIVEVLDSVQDALRWFAEHPAPDWVVASVQLRDGYSFEVFSQVRVQWPLVFVADCERYAWQAYSAGGLAYLLRPLRWPTLGAAVQRWHTLLQRGQVSGDGLAYKARFLVRAGDRLRAIGTDQIAYFYAEDKGVYLVDAQQRRFVLDYTLEELEQMLNPAVFYRLNRKFLVRLPAVCDIRMQPGGRLSVELVPRPQVPVLVSRERATAFKAWLDQ